MRNSLFVKIYLTVLVSLAAVVIASATFVHMSQERDNAACDALAAMPPADSDPALLQARAEQFSATFNADISVFFGPQRRLLAAIGRPISPQKFGSPRGILPGGHHLLFSPQPDGSVIAARLRMPLGPAGFLALIAAVIGLAAFPVVRHLTRRLEAMRQGVDRWGAGALDKRVAVRGSDEVAGVAASFNRAAEQFERLLAAHRSLLANASHELRSPLARLRMAIDLDADGQRGSVRDEIVRNLAELDALVEEILLAGRLDHIEKLERVEPVDLLALTAEEGARSGVDVSGEPGIVSGDPKLLTRLVRNLMQNAQRHGGPPFSAHVGIAGGSVVLKVCDHGPGLPEGTGERVFEPFFRPQGRSETVGGWGLGLSLVRKIALHHGATVHHESPSGGGACFVVTFPAYLDTAGAYPCESRAEGEV